MQSERQSDTTEELSFEEISEAHAHKMDVFEDKEFQRWNRFDFAEISLRTILVDGRIHIN